ncbi:phosphatidylglycerophosphatase A [Rhizomicrobium palustre]|uniref:Phosphatidylglycerophosphatase A n=1 Tax=Rhizomicrobium palustre TaxID=189966 RepID=A0A846N4L1_9PROT|nr:phosphatidylglycerophosphatase A [Rhizomicrobium palustre]NIK89980.1 phosphatidylglycerophosphatase A [Rhizomicrobium palustre]
MSAALATGFGVGRVSKAPGTVASLAALVIAIPVLWLTRWQGLAVLAVITTAVGVWASEQYANSTGIKDPKECVIDEFAGQWLACAIGAMAAMHDEPALSIGGYVAAFLLFRLFDIAKPGLIRRAEKLQGGLGIMADDVLAGAVAGFVVFLFAFSGFL